MSDNSTYDSYRQGHVAGSNNQPPPQRQHTESADNFARREAGYKSGQAGGA